MIYLAPIQGFTDYVYRKAYSRLFDTIDSYFIPYITVKGGTISKKYEREICSENNPQKRVVPQVLVKDNTELLFLSEKIENAGYREFNLNLGCPYPMVTNRGKGAGILPRPEKLKTLLSGFFEKSTLKLSVKLRAGLIAPEEIEEIITVLNNFPLSEVILHPRVARQLYKGEIIGTAFRVALQNLKHKLVYNGDIFSLADFEKRKKQFPKIDDWMLGRGVLMDPFLPAEIKNSTITAYDRIQKLKEFHHLIFEGYTETMDNEGNVLNKMQQFWSYFSYCFPNQKRVFKTIKKSRNINNYSVAVQKAFYGFF